MGLFGSKKKTYVGTTVNRLVEDKNIPNTLKQAGFFAVMNDEDPVDALTDRLPNSLAMKINGAYRYGKNQYYFGIPQGSMVYSTKGIKEITQVLEGIENKKVTLVYLHLGELNFTHTAKEYLQGDSKYNYKTNTYTHTENGRTIQTKVDKFYTVIPPSVYQSDPDAITDEQLKVLYDGRTNWGIQQTEASSQYSRIYYHRRTFNISLPKQDLSNTPYIQMQVAWQEVPRGNKYDKSSKQLQTYYETRIRLPIVLPENYNTGDFFQVAYLVEGSRQVKYYTYELGTNREPLLEKAYFKPEDKKTIGLFLPRGYYRYDGVNLGNDKQAHYKSSVKFHKKLSITYDDLVENVHKDAPNELMNAFLELAVPIHHKAQNQVEIQYLMEFFSTLYTAQQANGQIALGSSIQLTHLRNNLSASTDLKTSPKSFNIQDKRHNIYLSFKGIEKRVKVGNIGKKGKYKSFITGSAKKGLFIGRNPYSNYVTYQHQISDNAYEEILVYSPSLDYPIKGKSTSSNLSNDLDQFIIPVDWAVAKKLPLTKREELYARSLHMVFNTYKVVKKKWYQSGIFKVFMIAIAIAFTFMMPGSSPILQTLSLALSVGGVTGAILIFSTIGVVALTSVVINQLGRLAGKFLKVKLLAVLYIAVIALSAYGMYNGTSWVDYGLHAMSGLGKAIDTSMTKQVGKLQANIADFNKYREEKEKELKELENLLHSNVSLYPLYIPGESPKQFFTRTIGIGNLGPHTIQTDLNYVRNSLRLPTFIDSIQVIENNPIYEETEYAT